MAHTTARATGQRGALAAMVAAAVAFGALGAPPLDADDDAAAKQEHAQLVAVTPETVKALGRLVKDPLSPSGWSAEIEVTNPAQETVGLDVVVAVTESRGGGMSRMPAMPVVKFSQKTHLELLAGARVKQRVAIPKGTLSIKGDKVLRPTAVRVAIDKLRRADGTLVAAKSMGRKLLPSLAIGDLGDLLDDLEKPPMAAPAQGDAVAKQAPQP